MIREFRIVILVCLCVCTFRIAAEPTTAPANWKADDKAEVKRGTQWKSAVVNNVNGKWVLVTYDDTKWREWVEPWRLRGVGSTEDNIGYARPGHIMSARSKNQQPPGNDPGPPPPAGARPKIANSPARGGLSPAEPGNPELEKVAPLTKIDRTGEHKITIPAGEMRGEYSPEAAKIREISGRAVNLVAGPLDFFEHPEALLISSSGNAGVIYINRRPGQAQTLRIERVDLVAGTSKGVVKLPMQIAAMDLSPDGKLLLGHSTEPNEAGRISIWAIDGPAARYVLGCKLAEQNDSANMPTFAPRWAKFVGVDHVAMLSSSGTLMVLDVKGKAIWSCDAFAADPCLSAEGKYVAWTIRRDTIVIMEAMTGKVARVIHADAMLDGGLAFSPDGKRLAATAAGSMMILDLADGRIIDQFAGPNLLGSIAWCDDYFLLIDMKTLIGIAQHGAVHEYQMSEPSYGSGPAMVGNRLLFIRNALGRAPQPMLASVGIPDAAGKVSAGNTRDQDFAVRPGAKISIEVKMPDDLREKALAGLKASLASNGVTVEDNQPFKLVATSEPGKAVEMTYNNLGTPVVGPGAQSGTKISVNQVNQKLAIVGADGKAIWERYWTISPPMFLEPKPGESINDAVAKAMVPTAAFFEKTVLPKYVRSTPLPKSELGATR